MPFTGVSAMDRKLEFVRLALKRYAPATGPAEVRVVVEDPDGSRRVIYGAED